MHFHKGGLTIDLIIKPFVWECINKFEILSKITSKTRLPLKHMLKVETVTKIS